METHSNITVIGEDCGSSAQATIFSQLLLATVGNKSPHRVIFTMICLNITIPTTSRSIWFRQMLVVWYMKVESGFNCFWNGPVAGVCDYCNKLPVCITTAKSVQKFLNLRCLWLWPFSSLSFVKKLICSVFIFCCSSEYTVKNGVVVDV
jgi:hypothetical protein